MLKRLEKLRKIYKEFDKLILSKDTEKIEKTAQNKFDVFGKKKKNFSVGEEDIINQDLQYTADRLEDHVPKLQNRKVRIKSVFYMMAFMMWYIGVCFFIMYRVKGNDLDELEKEANEKINFSKMSKEFK